MRKGFDLWLMLHQIQLWARQEMLSWFNNSVTKNYINLVLFALSDESVFHRFDQKSYLLRKWLDRLGLWLSHWTQFYWQTLCSNDKCKILTKSSTCRPSDARLLSFLSLVARIGDRDVLSGLWLGVRVGESGISSDSCTDQQGEQYRSFRWQWSRWQFKLQRWCRPEMIKHVYIISDHVDLA